MAGSSSASTSNPTCDAAIPSSARRALAALTAEPAELILLDINMPEMNGLELCRALRGEAALADFGRAYCAMYVDSDLLVPSSGGVDRDDLRMTAVVPSRAAFADPGSAGATRGGREVSCVISRSDGEALTDRFSVI